MSVCNYRRCRIRLIPPLYPTPMAPCWAGSNSSDGETGDHWTESLEIKDFCAAQSFRTARFRKYLAQWVQKGRFLLRC